MFTVAASGGIPKELVNITATLFNVCRSAQHLQFHISGKIKDLKKSTTISFWGPETARWGLGFSTGGGGGRKLRALPRKFVFLEFPREESGMSRDFVGMSRPLAVFKKFVHKKVRAPFSFPNIGPFVNRFGTMSLPMAAFPRKGFPSTPNVRNTKQNYG